MEPFTFKNIPLTWSDFKQKCVIQPKCYGKNFKMSEKCQKSNKEPLMQFCPDSKLVGTLSNNSLLNHLDNVGLYTRSLLFFFPVIDKEKTQTVSHLGDQAFLKKKNIRGWFKTFPDQIERLILINTKNDHYGTDINNYMTCIRPLHNTYVLNIHHPHMP